MHQRDFDEDQRLARKLGMKERKAAPVGLQPAPQVGPVLDRMHRLVPDDLLQQRRGRAPVDLLQIEESGVEPRREQVAEVAVHGAKPGMLAQDLQQIAAHRDDRGRPAWCAVDPPHQLLPRRLDDALKLEHALGILPVRVRLGRPQHLLRVRRQL